MAHKKIFYLLLLVLVTSFTIILIFTILYLNTKEANKNPSTLITESESLIESVSNEKLPDSIKSMFNSLGDTKKSKKDQYETIKNIKLYFSSVYDSTNVPEIRNFSSNVLGKYAKENYPQYYKSDDFIITCADPYCGEKIDSDLQKILDMISSSKIADSTKGVVNYNITLAAYIPKDNLSEKKTGMRLAVLQLENTGNSQASEAAKKLREYFSNKYKTALFEILE